MTQQYTALSCCLVSKCGQRGFDLILKRVFELFSKAAEALNHSAECRDQQDTAAVTLSRTREVKLQKQDRELQIWLND